MLLVVKVTSMLKVPGHQRSKVKLTQRIKIGLLAQVFVDFFDLRFLLVAMSKFKGQGHLKVKHGTLVSCLWFIVFYCLFWVLRPLVTINVWSLDFVHFDKKAYLDIGGPQIWGAPASL